VVETLEDRCLLSVYAVTDLGTLGGTYSYANGINSLGQIVGFSYMPGDNASHAFLWQNGVMTDLGTLPGGSNSFAYGINDAGQIVGASYVADGTTRAVLWENGVIKDLGTLGGSSSLAQAINNHGEIVGWAAALPDDMPHAFRWENGVMTDLGKLTGDSSLAFGINDNGQIAGYSDTIPGQFSPHAILWDEAGLHDLGTLPGGAGSTALGINEYGQIIGKAKIGNPDEPHFAFLWENGVMKSLGGLPGARGSAGQGINRFTQIVGTSTVNFKAQAYVFFNGQMFNVNNVYPKSQSGWFFSVATGINDAGQIIGMGYGPNGQHAYLLRPVNPGSVATLRVTGYSTPMEAGSSYTFTVTAKDLYGNTVPNYTGTVSFASSDVQADLPTSYTFTPADQGSHTFTVTLKSAGKQWIEAWDVQNPALRGDKSGLGVTPGDATSFHIAGVPNPITAGTPISFTVSVRDAYGNVATDYRGTVTFASGDAKADLPAAYTFTATDAGVRAFTAILKTSRQRSLTVVDRITGLSATVRPTVHPAAPVAVIVTGPAGPIVAGATASFEAKVVDAFGNAVHAYRGTIGFESTDDAADLPPAYTFRAGDSGRHKFSAVLWTPGAHSLFVGDAFSEELSGTIEIVVIPPGAIGASQKQDALFATGTSPSLRPVVRPASTTPSAAPPKSSTVPFRRLLARVEPSMTIADEIAPEAAD
jgi:probable HAF family extracellular repeat protein